MTRSISTWLLCACLLVAGVATTPEDGLPRPANFDDEPNTSYGPAPALTNAGVPADCDWYGFSNTLYSDAVTSSCQATLRASLLNATANPPSELLPFQYYTLARLIDPATNESFCYQGCYRLNSAAPPITAPPPPPPYARGPAFEPIMAPVEAPAMVPAMEPVLAPVMAPVMEPAMAPVSESPYESPYGAPAMSPGN